MKAIISEDHYGMQLNTDRESYDHTLDLERDEDVAEIRRACDEWLCKKGKDLFELEKTKEGVIMHCARLWSHAVDMNEKELKEYAYKLYTGQEGLTGEDKYHYAFNLFHVMADSLMGLILAKRNL